jgi:hypothetical protein
VKDHLVVAAEDFGAFSHEMNATEHDISCGLLSGGGLRKTERVADVVGESDDPLVLIVMTQDGQLGATDPFDVFYALNDFGVIKRSIFVRENGVGLGK